MTKEIKKILNNTLDFKNLEENHLSIQLSLDGFSFCIYNTIHQQIGVFASYTFDEQNITPYRHLELIEKLFQEESLLRYNYTSVSVSHFNNLVSQVPKPFFDKENLAPYLAHTVKVLENDYITFDELQNSDIVNVYIPFVNINNFLLDTYGSFEYKHSSTILIEKLLSEFKNLGTAHCFVNVCNNNFEIVVLKNHKLELFNCFNFATKEDFIYYILFTAEQLNLNPEEIQLTLLGDIEKSSELYDILYKYVRNISFYKPSNESELLKHAISAHAHFTLLNQI